ncbi:hypothetical protein [Streptomyces melanogenes]|uniref:hypothetical protein n=1 Tax=Streptomyces melanogenes TaxID=67326 RepID=UPI00167E36B0|nr:hypothetical protein [Streptomyces melanogenes]GGP82284.1 hypothetical protein GCM10010278_71120 [Streptomyces melanogenes]
MRTHTGLDAAVFVAVLTTGALLILTGTPAGSLATICVALAGLYSTWTGHQQPRHAPHDEADDTPRTPDTSSR